MSGKSDAFKISLLVFILFMITMKAIPVSDTQANDYMPWLMIQKHTINFDCVTGSTTDYMYYPNPNGHFYSVFPPGTAVASLPVYLIPSLFIKQPTRLWMWMLGKTSASLMMALACMFIFLIAKKLFDRKIAIIATAIFALGTGVFAMASQMLLTFTGAILFLTMGCYFLVSGNDKTWYVIIAGFSFAFAGLCQLVCFVFLLLFGIYISAEKFKAVFWYALGAMPVIILGAIYNSVAYRAPWRTGEFLSTSFFLSGKWDVKVPLSKMWATPILKGLVNNLFSPSRGLLVFSPILVFAFLGLWVAWKQKGRLTFLLYGFAGCCITTLLASTWYDLSGGNCFGYRITLSVIPFLVLLVAASLPTVFRNRALKVLLVCFFAFSIFVQSVGYLSYDGGSWERRYLQTGSGVETKNTDKNTWSKNNQLFWEIDNFKFYVPPFWQGTKSYPANVTKVVDRSVDEPKEGYVRVGVITETPRIARISASLKYGQKMVGYVDQYIPRGRYTTWLPMVKKEGDLIQLDVFLSNVGVEDGYALGFALKLI